MRPRLYLQLFASIALSLCVACGGNSVSYDVLSPTFEMVWRPSFVVLFGIDPVAPQQAPGHCRSIARLRFTAHNEKMYHFGILRDAVRTVGGNGADDIVLISRKGSSFRYSAVAVRCTVRLFASSSGDDEETR